MSIYNSYAEAKIANPEGDIYASKMSMDRRKEIFGLLHSIESITSNYYECDPADYCMTVEKFLTDDHKFDDDDAYIDWKGVVRVVGKQGFAIFVCNNIDNIVYGDQAFILRAAALQPQFQNGDTVYDEDGDEYVYVAPAPGIKGNSVVVGEFRYFDIPTSDLTSEKPVTPKDGEWWMCEFKGVHALYDVVQFTHDGWEAQPLHQPTDIKPLYRMIRDTDTE